MTTVGVIGGTGLYDLDGLTAVHEVEVDTPYGKPSDALVTGELEGTRMVFVPRHGRGHRLLPTEVPYRANIFALKSLGVDWLISVSAVGSLKENVHPGEAVLPDQFLDRTRLRANTFFGEGIVAHVQFGDPVCPTLSGQLAESAGALGVPHHRGGTYVCMEGPAFSTRAESMLYRGWGVDVVGMTALPEAKLAREAEMHYATLAVVTDYDCWHQTETSVTVDAIMRILQENTERVRSILRHVVPRLPAVAAAAASCDCESALATAIVTDRDRIPPARREALAPLVGKYLR